MDTPSSFEFAKETVTQLITLATAVIGVSVTFAKEVQSGVTPTDRKWLFLSWIVLLVSVVFGVWTLMALTGSLATGAVAADTIYELNITVPCELQVVFFVVGIAMLIGHAIKGSRARREPGAGQELRGQYSLFTAEITTGHKEGATTDERG
jgi:hypothetical protein